MFKILKKSIIKDKTTNFLLNILVIVGSNEISVTNVHNLELLTDIQRDKTIYDKLIYIPNNNTQN